MNASAAAKLLGIHVRTAHRWVKQYEERPDSIFESGKKKGRRRILTEEHVKAIIDFIDANPSAVVAEVTEHLRQHFDGLKVTMALFISLIKVSLRIPKPSEKRKAGQESGYLSTGTVTDHYISFLKDTSDEMDKYPQMKGHYQVLDNASIHKAEDIAKYIMSRVYLCAYLPSYSPELNPIEQFWSVAKSKAP
ncbi:hypothetical protein VTP01DRAFT_3427 [Rhizomucor pusillus]|uniref:uncharacterized protein n=1 Tax=Rhizomucor pusillus TaxID=4840 RepID=UPI003742E81C